MEKKSGGKKMTSAKATNISPQPTGGGREVPGGSKVQTAKPKAARGKTVSTAVTRGKAATRPGKK